MFFMTQWVNFKILPSPAGAPTLLPIQFLANALGKVVEDEPSAWGPATHLETWMGPLAPESSLVQSLAIVAIRRRKEQQMADSLSLSPLLVCL